MSTTTSLWNVCRNSVAMRATWVTASGSSPFTWRIGAWMILATSEQKGPERELIGRSEEHTSELQSLMRISYAVFCLTTKTYNLTISPNDHHQRSLITTL